MQNSITANELVNKVAALMREQTDAYARLKSATVQLATAMTGSSLEALETVTRNGENELLRMRARLLQITATLTKFTEIRAQSTEKIPLDLSVRNDFETAAKDLLEVARDYKKVSERAANLAFGGTTFISGCIESCGILPITYRAPILRREDFDQ